MSNIAALLVVVKRLGTLRRRVVFVGGSVRGLLITDEAAPPERPTDDVDAIVSIAAATRGLTPRGERAGGASARAPRGRHRLRTSVRRPPDVRSLPT